MNNIAELKAYIDRCKKIFPQYQLSKEQNKAIHDNKKASSELLCSLNSKPMAIPVVLYGRRYNLASIYDLEKGTMILKKDPVNGKELTLNDILPLEELSITAVVHRYEKLNIPVIAPNIDASARSSDSLSATAAAAAVSTSSSASTTSSRLPATSENVYDFLIKWGVVSENLQDSFKLNSRMCLNEYPNDYPAGLENSFLCKTAEINSKIVRYQMWLSKLDVTNKNQRFRAYHAYIFCIDRNDPDSFTKILNYLQVLDCYTSENAKVIIALTNPDDIALTNSDESCTTYIKLLKEVLSNYPKRIVGVCEVNAKTSEGFDALFTMMKNHTAEMIKIMKPEPAAAPFFAVPKTPAAKPADSKPEPQGSMLSWLRW